jgi:hypothetical protein
MVPSRPRVKMLEKMANTRLRSAAVIIVVYLVCTLYFWSRAAIILDDPYIYLRIVENMINGHGPVWNVGDRYTNATSALWLTVLALTGAAFRTDQLPLVLKVLYFLCLSGASVFLMLIFRRSGLRRVAWGAPFILFLPEKMIAITGMDSGLVLLCLLATIWAYRFNKSLHLVAPLSSLLCLARPDNAAFVTFLLLDIIALRKFRSSEGQDRASILLSLTTPALEFLAIMIMMYSYMYYYTGNFIPLTLHAKLAQGTIKAFYWKPYWMNIVSTLDPLRQNYFLIGLTLMGLPRTIRDFPLITLWVGFEILIYSLLKVPGYVWYYYPVYVFIALSLFVGLFELLTLLVENARAPLPKFRTSAFTAAGAIFAITAITGISAVKAVNLREARRFMNVYGYPDIGANPRYAYEDSRRIALNQVADWFSIYHPETKGAAIVTDEIGIIGYRLRDWRVYDEAGLTDPSFTASRLDDWGYYVRTRAPEFLVQNYVVKPDTLRFRAPDLKDVVYTKVFTAKGSFVSEIYRRQ